MKSTKLTTHIALHRCDSTNSFLMKNAKDYPPFTIISARNQTGGRGRFSRVWHAIPEKDLAFSILLPLKKEASQYWQNLSQVAALALCEILEEQGLTPAIKWPNDVLVDNKKICGILCETIIRDEGSLAVLGMGVNLNSTAQELAAIEQPATSVLIETGTVTAIEPFCERIGENIAHYTEKLQNEGFSPFYEPLKKRMALLNIPITVKDGNRTIKGEIMGLCINGTINFQEYDGEMINLNSGEISFNPKSFEDDPEV